MFDKLKKSLANASRPKDEESGVVNNASAEVKDATLDLIKVSTSGVSQPFEVVDVIFAFDSHKEGFLESGADPTRAFVKVVNRLRAICAELGGHAVINCQFDYRYAVGESMMGNAKQVVEIYAYGTAIRFLE